MEAGLLRVPGLAEGFDSPFQGAVERGPRAIVL